MKSINGRVSLVALAILVAFALGVMTNIGEPKVVDDLKREQISIGDSKLKSADSFISFGFGYSQTGPFENPKRQTDMSYVSPFYEPHNYTLGIVLKDETTLHAHLDNVRLVKSGGEELLKYYNIGESEYYIELNISAEAFDAYLTEDFFVNCDQYQIVFVKQYLSDAAIDLTTSGGEPSE